MRAFLVALSLAVLTSTAGAQFVTFETGQVRPLALSPDQSKLFAINNRPTKVSAPTAVAPEKPWMFCHGSCTAEAG